LTADALERVDRDPEGALRSAQDAVKLAPDLVPAAALAGRLLSRKGDLRKAAKVVEAAWSTLPHPDLAEVYLNLRPGDSALDRLKRAETLSRLSNGAPEGRLAVARSALEAREFDRARDALEPLLQDRPSMRVCLLMSDLEQAEHGSTGKGREWLARATRAPRDPAWIADGVVSDHWAPISPVTGRLDAFVWQAPPDVLIAPELTLHDDVTADLDDEVRALPIAAAEEPASAPVSEPVPAPEPAPVENEVRTETALAEPIKEDAREEAAVSQPEPVVFPTTPPDVPKPKEQASARRSVFSVW
jgi:HemY protein